MALNYFLKLEKFEGPLDLLLHLIKVHEIDIFNIDIFLLTEQYLEYLRLIHFDDLTGAGEFLEMAATLIEIKSRMLIPSEERGAESNDLDDDDPRRPLQDRLIEYERIRLAANFLGTRPQVGVQVLTSREWERLEPLYQDIEYPLTGDPLSLLLLFEQMLRDFAERKPPARVEAITHKVTVEQTIIKLKKLLATVDFALFQGFYKNFQSRYELVVNIMAVLELSKWGDVRVFQQDLNGPIWIHRSDYDSRLLPMEQIAEPQQQQEGEL
ncbi:MAG: ScpA family protein [Oligoflexales bacterium]